MKVSINKSLILAILTTVGCVHADITQPSTEDSSITKTTITSTITTTISNSEINLLYENENENETIAVTADLFSEYEDSEEDTLEQTEEIETAMTTDVLEEENIEEVKEEDNDDFVDIYKNMITSFNYGDQLTYVIGHKSPDSDTVGSAIAYADLLNKLGIKAQAVVSGPLNGESQYYFNYFGLKSPEILTNAEGKQFVLVDHSNYLQAIDGMASARIVGIIDHHNVGDITSNEPIYARFAPVGAAASIIYLIYNELHIPISKETAQVMIMSILSDTHYLTGSTTKAIDKKALSALQKITGLEDSELEIIYKEMTAAKASYDGMTEEAIYKSDYKEYEVLDKFFCMGNMNAKGEEETKALADRMYDYIETSYPTSGFNMMFAMVQNISEDDENENVNENENDEIKTYLFGYGEDAEKILEKAFGDNADFEFDGKYYKTKLVLSRKTHVIPVITEYINNNGNIE